MDRATSLAVCRAAHEVWLLEDEDKEQPTSRDLLQFRTESAPPCTGERSSFLNAPEVGPVRTWRRVDQRYVDISSDGSSDQASAELLRQLGAISKLLTEQGRRNSVGWERSADTLRQHAEILRFRMRAALAFLFVVTSLGIVGLQWLAMSGLNIPMADLYAVFFLCVGGIYMWGRRLHWNEVQLGWHALADALEVQAAFCKVGIKQNPITSLYPLRQRRHIEWVREALRSATWKSHISTTEFKLSARELLTEWIPASLGRHKDKSHRQSIKARWLEWGMIACYVISAILTTAVVSGVVLEPKANLAINAGIGLTSSMGTLLLIFNGVLGFSQDAALHGHLSDVFMKAEGAMVRGISEHECDELLMDLGRELVQISAERTLL